MTAPLIKRDLTSRVVSRIVSHMSTNQFSRNNNTKHVEVRFTDGEVFTEKHRDSWGGWLNMLRRVEARVGGEARSREVGGDVVFAANGREFTFVEVMKL